MIGLKIIAFLAATAVACCAPSKLKMTDSYKKSLIYRLKSQGFSTSLDYFTEINYLGQIQTSNSKFNIFYYKHITPENDHEFRRIIILQNNTYIGSYMLDNLTNCNVKKNLVRCRGDSSIGNQIIIDDIGPPEKIVFGGDLVIFEK